MPVIEQPCMQFLYVVPISQECSWLTNGKGELRWWSVDEAQHLSMPQANAMFLPRVLDMSWVFYQAKYVYDVDWQLVDLVEHIHAALDREEAKKK